MWSDFTKIEDYAGVTIDSIEIHSPILFFFSEVVLIPYGHEDIEDHEIATADLVCFVDEFGKGLFQESKVVSKPFEISINFVW
jgi:hypothetical protein